MLTQEPTHAMLEEWKQIWLQYRDQLQPNRRSGQELLEYLSGKYALTEIHDPDYLDVVTFNVTMNEAFAEKLSGGKPPLPKAFFIKNEGAGKQLYLQQDEIFRDVEQIFVGIDLNSGCFFTEGSSLLWDELCAFQGLDAIDLGNPFLVAMYVRARQKFNLPL